MWIDPLQEIAHEKEHDRLLPERGVGQRLMTARAESVLEAAGNGAKCQRERQVEQHAVDDGVSQIRHKPVSQQRLSHPRTKVSGRKQRRRRDAADQCEPHAWSPSTDRSEM